MRSGPVDIVVQLLVTTSCTGSASGVMVGVAGITAISVDDGGVTIQPAGWRR